MLKGYGNHATQLGYQKIWAVPLTEAAMKLLLQSMHETCNSSSTYPHQQMLLLRDGMLFSLLWQSCVRGFNADALRLDSVVLPIGENAISDARVQAAGWCSAALAADTTKNKKRGHCKNTLTRDVMCFSTWFQMAVHHHADADGLQGIAFPKEEGEGGQLSAPMDKANTVASEEQGAYLLGVSN
ncbi:TPA: hypothetical protein ACH3X3_004934 [Trebouxia sp. C0006]